MAIQLYVANIDAVFNKSEANLSEAFVVLTTHGYLTADPTGLETESSGAVTKIVFSPSIGANELLTLASPTQSFTAAYNAAALTHEIVVSVVNNKYSFSPSVSEFLKGHTYIFDNRINHQTHPLNFDDENGGSPYDFNPNENGYTTVTIPVDATYEKLFAHCANNHPDMESDVNNGSTGIPVNDVTHDLEYIIKFPTILRRVRI